MTALYNFFVLVTGNDGTTPKRAPMTKDLQRELSGALSHQKEHFLNAVTLVPYDPTYTPEPDERFIITNYSLDQALADAVAHPNATPNIDSDEIEALAVRSFLAARNASTGPELLFQRFDARQIVQRKRTLMLHQDIFQRPGGAGLVVQDAIVAVYEHGSLVFRGDWHVRSFLDLNDHFEAATDEQIADFISGPLWSSANTGALLPHFDRYMRNRVAWISREKVLDGLEPRKLRAVARAYGIELTLTGKKNAQRIVLPEDKKSMKMLIRLLAEELLHSDLSDERYQTNSRRRI
jgi:hypothetical protein